MSFFTFGEDDPPLAAVDEIVPRPCQVRILMGVAACGALNRQYRDVLRRFGKPYSFGILELFLSYFWVIFKLLVWRMGLNSWTEFTFSLINHDDFGLTAVQQLSPLHRRFSSIWMDLQHFLELALMELVSHHCHFALDLIDLLTHVQALLKVYTYSFYDTEEEEWMSIQQRNYVCWNLWELLRHLKHRGFVKAELLQVYKSITLPFHDYCSTVYHYTITKTQIAALERLQAQSLKAIYGYEFSYRQLLETSGLERQETRRERRAVNFARVV